MLRYYQMIVVIILMFVMLAKNVFAAEMASAQDMTTLCQKVSKMKGRKLSIDKSMSLSCPKEKMAVISVVSPDKQTAVMNFNLYFVDFLLLSSVQMGEESLECYNIFTRTNSCSVWKEFSKTAIANFINLTQKK